jgi:leucyl-tRNA synthetase
MSEKSKYPDFHQIESHWQKQWELKQTFKAEQSSAKPKYYALSMFPYPSGVGLHIGHIASYTPTDIVSRYKRAQGFNVLHPMGYDAFGLPAEQHAIQTGVHPAQTTLKAIETFRRQLKSFGFSYDWSREISTCEPSYYKWTQFIFSELFAKGLAYQKEVPVNWCPALKTVLANEEIVDGKSERGGHPVIRMPMKQWMLKITAYAERLLQDLEFVDWPERTKDGQRNWIGKSEGALVRFSLKSFPTSQLEVFTTRPDTLFGVSFMVLAPEHPLVDQLTTAEQKASVQAYQFETSKKSEVDRKANTVKTGVFTGGYALHPFLKQKDGQPQLIPVWISDYVLMDYGSGAIMAVPGHDTRDFEFAQKFNLPVIRVLESEQDLPFEGDGRLVNSDFLNGLTKNAAIQKMLTELEQQKIGARQVQYKLRDWLFSRQRYWGEPFPVIHLKDGTLKTVPANELPVTLPEVADYEPSDKGEAPLAKIKDWVSYTTADGQQAQRETDTMPGAAGSSWYFLRFTDPLNSEAAFGFENQKYWMPVDLYIGGPEHTVGHLLYARFWQKVLFDAGLVSHPEPFKKLAHQGMILGSDGEKMSKSRGNVVNLDEIVSKYGADALRTFISFMGPMEKDKPWSPHGIDGVKRFLDRLTRLVVDENGLLVATQEEALSDEALRVLHKTIKKVTADIENMSFNTSISAMMILVNELYRMNIRSTKALRPLVQMLMPFAPHLAEELWQKLGGKDFVSLAPWPKFDPALAQDDKITLAVQVNGKMRGTVELPIDASEELALSEALKISTVTNALGTAKPAKVIYKAGKILNLIAGK